MLLSQIDENQLNDNIINKMLFDIPKDDGLKGDCIWVFGSNITQNERVKIAAKLYKEGRAPFVLLSGGLGTKGKIAEALVMKDLAMELGIPEESIILEENSNNTTENVLCSILVLERKFLLQNIKRLIVVTSPFHMQRLILTINRYMPKWIEYSYCYDENSPLTKENWAKDKDSRKKIEHEAKRIIYYAKNKYIDDKEIDI